MITSVNNPLVKETIKLQKKANYRQKTKRFVAEGFRMLTEVPHELLDKVFVVEGLKDEEGILQQLNPSLICVVSLEVMKVMSMDVTTQGILMWVNMPDVKKKTTSGDKDFVLATDCVQDPGNLGTLIRTAEAAGVKSMRLSKGTVDVYNPKVVKATMGAIFRMDIQCEVELCPYLSTLRDQGYKVIGTHLKGIKTHYEVSYKDDVCLVVGNEGNGMGDEVARSCTDLVKIPMTQEAESLNVAMAAGIMLYEVVRQRL